MSKYSILEKYKNINIHERNLQEFGDKEDLEELKVWLESEKLSELKKKKKIPYIHDDLEKINFPSNIRISQNFKKSYHVYYLENKIEKEGIQNLDYYKGIKNNLEYYEGQGGENWISDIKRAVFLPQKEVVIYFKFFLKVIDVIENGEKPISDFKWVKESIIKDIDRIENFYLASLFDDPYLNEKIFYRLKLNEKLKLFDGWRFKNYSTPANETKEKLIKGLMKSKFLSETQKNNYFEKRKAFRRLAQVRMDRIGNEIRKLSNLSTKTNYKFVQSEIEELLDSLIEIINQAFKNFKPIGLQNPHQIEKKRIDIELEKMFEKKNIDKPTGSDLEVELKSLKKSMLEKFVDLELKINSSKEENKND